MSRIGRPTLRSVLGKADLDALLSERERLSEDLEQILEQRTEPWGIKVRTVEIKDVGIPSTMQRAIARQAEAERERRAEIMHAEGEHAAPARLSRAAAILNGPRRRCSSGADALRARRRAGSTVVFPLPVLLRPLLETAASAPVGDDDPGRAGPRAAR
jgi:regulator of protease activity HflC (stomatin/prohibitin superfamily)